MADTARTIAKKIQRRRAETQAAASGQRWWRTEEAVLLLPHYVFFLPVFTSKPKSMGFVLHNVSAHIEDVPLVFDGDEGALRTVVLKLHAATDRCGTRRQ